MSESRTAGIQTIFCATDFSDTSELAIRHTAALARRHDARIVIGHVVEPLPIEPYPLPMALPEGEAKVRELAWQRLEDVGEALRDSGLVVETQQGIGPPGPQLVEMACKAEASVVVIGTRGQTGLQHLLLGSTAEYVVRRSTAPVITIHPDDRETIETPRLVVVPTDLSTDAEVAMEAFIDLFDGDHRPKLELVFADSTPPYLEAMSHERLAKFHQPDARREELEKHIAPMVKRLEGHGFEVGLQVLDGDPVEAVTNVADVEGADLIVMSTHGRSALVNALLGRTAQRVVQRATCPVLTVCPKRRRVKSD